MPALAALAALALIAGVGLAGGGALAKSAPGTPASVTVTRADGSLTASWDAVAGATSYHVTYTDNGGQSWQLAAFGHAATTITIAADNASTYIVGVRARNEAGGSGWRNSAPAGPFTPTPTPTPTPPATVASVTVSRGDGTLTAEWDAPAGATSYHVTYSDDGGASWSLAALAHAATSIAIDADNASTYVVGVRAKNSGGGSGWRNSAPAGPYVPPPPSTTPARPTGLTATAGDGSVTLTWDDPADASITGYEYRVRWAGVAWSAWTAVAGSATSIAVEGLTNGTEHRFKVRAVNAAGASGAAPAASPWYVAATPDAPTLTATDPTQTSAVLTMGNYSGAWHYRVSETSGGGGGGGGGGASGQSGGSGCVGPIGGAETTVTGLDPDTSYTIHAYVGGCWGASIASATAQTQQQVTFTASNVGATTATLAANNWVGDWWRKEVSPAAFGDCRPGGAVSGLAGGQLYRFQAYSDSGCTTDLAVPVEFTTLAPSLTVDNVTGRSARLTLSIWLAADPDWRYRADTGPHAACSASGVSGGSVDLTGLAANTTYDYAVYSGSACHYSTVVGRVRFTTTVSLAVTVDTWKSGALVISGWTGDWWHDNGRGGGCTKVDSPATQTSVALAYGGSTAHSFKAYGAAGCAAADLIAAAERMVNPPEPRLAADHIGVRTATVRLHHWDRQWWYRSNSGLGSPCTGPVAAGTNTVTFSISAGIPVFVAYPNGSCSVYNSLATLSFKVPNKVVGNIDEPSITGVSGIVGRAGRHGVVKRANAFTTSGGGTVQNVTLMLRGKVGAPGDIVVAIHNADANGQPGSQRVTLGITTISGASPLRPGEYVYTCGRSACGLAANTTYFLVLSAASVPASGVHSYAWQYTSADTEGAGAGGWTIGDASHLSINGGAWAQDVHGRALRFKLHVQ